MEAGFKVKLGADTSELTKGFAVANDAIRSLSANIVSLTNVLKQGLKIDTGAIIKASTAGANAIEGMGDKAVKTAQSIANISSGPIKIDTAGATTSLNVLGDSAEKAGKQVDRWVKQADGAFLKIKVDITPLATVAPAIEKVKQSITATPLNIDTRPLITSASTVHNELIRISAEVQAFKQTIAQGVTGSFKITADTKSIAAFQSAVNNVTGKDIKLSVVTDVKTPNLSPVINEANVAKETFTKLRNEIGQTGTSLNKISGTKINIPVQTTGMQVGADGVLRLQNGIKALQVQLVGLQKQLASAGNNPAAIQSLNTRIADTTAQLNKLVAAAGTPFKNITTAATTAAAAVSTTATQVTKLANPFQAVAVGANALKNVQPPTSFISSVRNAFGSLSGYVSGVFGNIKGAISGAFSSMGQVAASAGSGVMSLIESFGGLQGILVGAGIGLFALGEKLLATSAAEAAAKTAIADYKDEMAKASAAVAKETASLDALLFVAKDETLTREQRNKAIKELQTQYPAYLGNLSLENVNSVQMTANIDKLTEAIVRKAKAEALSNLIVEETQKKQKAFNKDVTESIDKFDIAGAVLKNTFATFFQNKNATIAATALDLTQKGLKKNADEAAVAQKNIDQYTEQLKLVTREQFLFGDNLDKTKTKAEKHVKRIKDIADVMGELQAAQKSINFDESVGLISPREADVDRLNLFEQKIKEIFALKSSVASDSSKIQAAIGINLMATPSSIRVDTLDKSIKDKVKTVERQIVIEPWEPVLPVAPSVKLTKDPLEDLRKEMNDTIQQMTKQLQVDLAVGVGEGIGDAISGANIGDAFKGLFGILGSFFKQLGAYMISVSPIIKGIKEALKTLSPAGLLIGGIGLVAIGALIQKTMPKFATGTMTTGITAAIIGDNPSGREYVTPSESIGRLAAEINGHMGNGSSNGFVVEHFISGQDLRLMIKRADDAYARGY
jgi:hypothetical protein